MKPKSYGILKDLKNITNIFAGQLSQTIKSIKDTYEDDIMLVKEELLTKIASDYSLDISELKRRYLRRKKKVTVTTDNVETNAYFSDSEYMPVQPIQLDNVPEQVLLYKILYNENDYYVELIEGGKVFDSKQNEIGIWKNGFMELNMDLIEQLKLLETQLFEENNNTCNITVSDDDFCKVSKKPADNITTLLDTFVDSTKKSVDNKLITKRKKKIIQSDVSKANASIEL